MKILIVEDDPAIARGLQVNLESEGYQTDWANSLKQAFEKQNSQQVNLVLLDLGLGNESGFDFLKWMRDQGSRLPIIILTAQTDEDSVVQGLQLGANDYVKKPFGNRELMARIKAALREPMMRDEQVRIDPILILLEKRVVLFNQEPIELNRREFDILLFLGRRMDSIVSRETLIQSIDKEGEIFDRTIDSHVSHLRSKLKKAGVIELKISSVYGVGYRLERVSAENSEST